MNTRGWMLCASWVIGVLGFLGIAPAFLSVMLFDAPGSEDQATTRLAAQCIVMFPLACLLGIAMGWSVFKQGREHWGLVIVCSPVLVILLFIATLACITAFRGGRLAG